MSSAAPSAVVCFRNCDCGPRYPTRALIEGREVARDITLIADLVQASGQAAAEVAGVLVGAHGFVEQLPVVGRHLQAPNPYQDLLRQAKAVP